jgi:hypothetical protein
MPIILAMLFAPDLKNLLVQVRLCGRLSSSSLQAALLQADADTVTSAGRSTRSAIA